MGIPMTNLKDFVGHPICWVSAAAFGTKTNQKEKRKRAAQKKEILTALTKSTELFIKVSANHSSMKTDCCNWS